MTGAYATAMKVFSLAFVALGTAILARTVTSGGGPLSLGVVMGLAMVAIGIARLWLATRLGDEPDETPPDDTRPEDTPSDGDQR